ncbi:MAG: aldo/keto reductase [Pirellulales bacterium]|nr:aldo/keto reductase [Pirellulales bacterium]
MTDPWNRRRFMQAGAASGVLLSLAEEVLAGQQDAPGGLPMRPLGATGQNVSLLCLGGWHIGATAKQEGEDQAVKLMHQAIDNGLTFFDNCWDYHNGFSEQVMGKAIEDRRDKVFLMTKVCNRDYDGVKANLEESLQRLRTDHLDLWQFHEMVYDNDPDWVFDQGGLKAALEAHEAGKVRFIGFTGHKDPSIHLKMLNKPYRWATAQMPINVCDYFFRSFLHGVVPHCLQQGTAVLGMKSLAGGALAKTDTGLTAPECLRFALSQPVSALVCGMRTERDLQQALDVGRDFKPLSQDEQQAILDKVRHVAADGRHELFKTAKNFDGPYHRQQHGFAAG